MKKLLLVGNGYLGKAVAGEFAAAEWEVTAVSLSGGEGALSCDVADPVAVASLAEKMGPVDAIVHCAASCKGGEEAYRRVYVDGCRNLASVFPESLLLFTSSTSVYAQMEGEEVSEESRAEPSRETGRLLLEAEARVLAAGGIVARLSGIYGPGRSVILRKFLAGEAVIEEDGRRFLNQIHRDDAARAVLHLVAGGFRGIFNVSDSRPLSQIECYHGLAECFHRPLPPRGARDLNRKRGWTHKRVSNGKLVGSGWSPAYACFLDAAEAIAAGFESE